MSASRTPTANAVARQESHAVSLLPSVALRCHERSEVTTKAPWTRPIGSRQGAALAVGVRPQRGDTTDTDAPTIGGLAETVCFHRRFSGKISPLDMASMRRGIALLAQSKGSMPAGLRKTPGKSTGATPGTSLGVAFLLLRLSTKLVHVYNPSRLDGCIA